MQHAMTPKQEERLRKKITKIKAALAADRKRCGGFYDDSRGLRYLPPGIYLQLGDYTGGLRYLNWFKKNFPDDSGFPDFLFEWAVILFKRGRLKEAERMVFKAFTTNTYLFDKFFGKPVTPIDKWEWSNLAGPDFAINYFDYSHTQENLKDVADWADSLFRNEKFAGICAKYIDIYKILKCEDDPEVRRALMEHAEKLEGER